MPRGTTIRGSAGKGSVNNSAKFKPMAHKIGQQKKHVYKNGDRDIKRDGKHVAFNNKTGFGHVMLNGDFGHGRATRKINLRGWH